MFLKENEQGHKKVSNIHSGTMDLLHLLSRQIGYVFLIASSLVVFSCRTLVTCKKIF